MRDYIKETIAFYEENLDEYIKNTDKLQDKAWLRKFVGLLPKNAFVLDLGCGYGRDSKFFVKNNFRTYGVDLSKAMIERAKETIKGANFFVMDLLDLDFPPDYFDGVWCSALLVHISKKDIDKAFIQIKRILKKEGILYLNLKEGTGEGFESDTRYGGSKKFHSYYSETEIKTLLNNNDLQIDEFEIIKPKGYRFTGTIYVIARKL